MTLVRKDSSDQLYESMVSLFEEVDNVSKTFEDTFNEDVIEDTGKTVIQSKLSTTGKTVIQSKLSEDTGKTVIQSKLSEDTGKTVIQSKLSEDTGKTVIQSKPSTMPFKSEENVEGKGDNFKRNKNEKVKSKKEIKIKKKKKSKTVRAYDKGDCKAPLGEIPVNEVGDSLNINKEKGKGKCQMLTSDGYDFGTTPNVSVHDVFGDSNSPLAKIAEIVPHGKTRSQAIYIHDSVVNNSDSQMKTPDTAEKRTWKQTDTHKIAQNIPECKELGFVKDNDMKPITVKSVKVGKQTETCQEFNESGNEYSTFIDTTLEDEDNLTVIDTKDTAHNKIKCSEKDSAKPNSDFPFNLLYKRRRKLSVLDIECTPKRQKHLMFNPQYSNTDTLSPIEHAVSVDKRKAATESSEETPVILSKFQFTTIADTDFASSTPIANPDKNKQNTAKKSIWGFRDNSPEMSEGECSLFSTTDLQRKDEMTYEELIHEITAICEEGMKRGTELSCVADQEMKVESNISKIDIQSIINSGPREREVINAHEHGKERSELEDGEILELTEDYLGLDNYEDESCKKTNLKALSNKVNKRLKGVDGSSEKIDKTLISNSTTRPTGRFKNITASVSKVELEDGEILELTEDYLGLDNYEDESCEKTLLADPVPVNMNVETAGDKKMDINMNKDENTIPVTCDSGKSKSELKETFPNISNLKYVDKIEVKNKEEKNQNNSNEEVYSSNWGDYLSLHEDLDESQVQAESSKESNKKTDDQVKLAEANKENLNIESKMKDMNNNATSSVKLTKIEKKKKQTEEKTYLDISIFDTSKMRMKDGNALMAEVSKRWKSKGIPCQEMNLTVATTLRKRNLAKGLESIPGILEGEQRCCLNLYENLVELQHNRGEMNSSTVEQTLGRLYRQKEALDGMKHAALYRMRMDLSVRLVGLKERHSREMQQLYFRQQVELRQLNICYAYNLLMLEQKLMQVGCEHNVQCTRLHEHQGREYSMLCAQLNSILQEEMERHVAQIAPIEQLIKQLESADNLQTGSPTKYGPPVMVTLRKAPCKTTNKQHATITMCLPASIAQAVSQEDDIFDHFYTY